MKLLYTVFRFSYNQTKIKIRKTKPTTVYRFSYDQTFPFIIARYEIGNMIAPI